MADDRAQVHEDFRANVNMPPAQSSAGLDRESKSVGEGAGESKGHRSGRHIVKILNAKKADLSDSDYDPMRRVNAYVSRHLAQRPKGDVTDTNWARSLRSWGRDPELSPSARPRPWNALSPPGST